MFLSKNGVRRFFFFRKSVTDPPDAGIDISRTILGERAPIVPRKQQAEPIDTRHSLSLNAECDCYAVGDISEIDSKMVERSLNRSVLPQKNR